MSLTLQEIIQTLENYWAKEDCIILQPYDIEKGAGTFNPATFLRCLGTKPWACAYVEPSRRPQDGRYGENPNRLRQHFQFQVVIKPPPANIQSIYLNSLTKLGIRRNEHDIRFMEDDWQAPTLGAWGVGWEVWLDGLEITQFTYFQQAGGIDLKPITVELTYGLERIAMFIQKTDNVFNVQWSENTGYGDLFLESEQEFSRYNFQVSDPEFLKQAFNKYRSECTRLLKNGLLLPAYDFVLKCSHTFNVLDARGTLEHSERNRYIADVRELANAVADAWVKKHG